MATDIEASNGVIHVIDSVILPPQPSAMNETNSRALDVIDRAVNKGVPLFNHGNPTATAAIYEIAAQDLMAFADEAGLSSAATTRLRDGMRRASAQHNARQQAWTLRYALDDVRAELVAGSAMQMAKN